VRARKIKMKNKNFAHKKGYTYCFVSIAKLIKEKKRCTKASLLPKGSISYVKKQLSN